jgi:Na+/melibiose symporter-like transporter
MGGPLRALARRNDPPLASPSANPSRRAAFNPPRAFASSVVVVVMVVMVMVPVPELPDDAANDPVMVVMVMVMVAAMMVMIARELHVAVELAGRLLLRLARRRGVGSPKRRDRIWDRVEQLGE